MKRFGVLVLMVVGLAGCGERGLSDGQGAATPSLCAMNITSEGRLNGSDPVFVADGQLLAVRVDQADHTGELIKRDFVGYRFIDAEVEVTSARIGVDDDGNATTAGGFGEYNTVPGTFYQFYHSGFAEQVVIEVPTGRSYKFYSSDASNGLVGTCDAE